MKQKNTILNTTTQEEIQLLKSVSDISSRYFLTTIAEQKGYINSWAKHPKLLQVKSQIGDRLNKTENSFISKAFQQKIRTRKIQNWTIGITLFIVTVLGVFGWYQAKNATNQAVKAINSFNESEIKRLDALFLLNQKEQPIKSALISCQSLLNSQGFDKVKRIDRYQNIVNSLMSLQGKVFFTGESQNIVSSISENAGYLVQGGYDGSLRIWDTKKSNAPLFTEFKHTTAIDFAQISYDGSIVITKDISGKTFIWLRKSGIINSSIIMENFEKSSFITISPDHSLFALANNSGNILLIKTDGQAKYKVTQINSYLGKVTALSINNNNKYLAAGDENGDIEIFEINSTIPTLISHFKTPHKSTLHFVKPAITDISIDSSCNYIISSTTSNFNGDGVDLKAYIYRLNFTKDHKSLQGKVDCILQHKAMINSNAISWDGKYFATGSYDGFVNIAHYNKATGDYIVNKLECGSPVLNVMFSKDGKVLIATGYFNEVKSWDVNTLKQMAPLKGHESSITGICESPDGNSFVTSSNDGASIIWNYDRTKNFLINSFEANMWIGDNGVAPEISSNKQFMAVREKNGTIGLYAISEKIGRKLLYTYPNRSPLGGWLNYSFSSDNRYFLISNFGNGNVILYDLKLHKNSYLSKSGHSKSAFFINNNKHLLITEDSTGKGYLLAVKDTSGNAMNTFSYKGDAIDKILDRPIFEENGHLIYLGGKGNQLMYFDQKSNKIREIQLSKEKISDLKVAFTDGELFAATFFLPSINSNILRLYKYDDRGNISLIHESSLPKRQVRDLYFSPKTKYLITKFQFQFDEYNFDSSFHIYNLSNLQNIQKSIGNGNTDDIKFSPNDSLLIITYHNKDYFNIFFPFTNNFLQKGIINTGNNHSGTSEWTIKFSKRSDFFIVATSEKMRLFKVYGQQVNVTDFPYSSRIVEFSKNDSLLVTGGSSGLSVWSTDAILNNTLKPIIYPIGLSYGLSDLGFLDSDKLIFGLDGSGEAFYLNINFDIYLQNLKSKINRNFSWNEWHELFPDKPYSKLFQDLPGDNTVIAGLIEEAKNLNEKGNNKEANNIFRLAKKYAFESGNPYSFNRVCWNGCLYGFYREVYELEDSAIKLMPTNSNFYDTRGLLNALRGNYKQAIQDYEYFLEDYKMSEFPSTEVIRRREEWLISLKEKKNPFDENAILYLRSE